MLGIVIYGGLLIQPHVEVRIVDEARADVPVGKRGALWTHSGENICPREIEEFLFTHKDVQEVQVFDIPHEKYGEEVYAWIVQRAGATLAEEDVKAYCQNQIAHYNIPKHVRMVSELPMIVTGKP
ncbi:hypothetical protein [Sneathiella sp.]|uniref:AMP-binding enzyme n=1 Tax=Sneathiella sp. TaxID=1964365 RepID=UPI0035613EF8